MCAIANSYRDVAPKVAVVQTYISELGETLTWKSSETYRTKRYNTSVRHEDPSSVSPTIILMNRSKRFFFLLLRWFPVNQRDEVSELSTGVQVLLDVFLARDEFIMKVLRWDCGVLVALMRKKKDRENRRDKEWRASALTSRSIVRAS